MISVVLNNLNLEGEWVDFDYEGTAVEFKIRPLFYDIGKVIEERYKQTRIKKHAQKIKHDWRNLCDDIIDYVLEDFRGFGTSPDKHFEITLNNKKIIGQLPGVADFIMKTTRDLAEKRIKDVLCFDGRR